MGVDGNFLAGDGGDLALSDHADGTGNGLVLVVDHSAGLAAGHQGAVSLVGTVREDLAGHLQAHLLAGFQHLAAGKAQKNDVLVDLSNAFSNGEGEVHVLGGHVVERAVGLAVLQLHALCLAERHESANLVLDVSFCLLGGDHHVAPAKAHQIGIAGVSADGNTCGLRRSHSLGHHQGVAGVIAAGNVGRRDVGNDFTVKADGVGAKALAKVAVQVYFVHNVFPPSHFVAKLCIRLYSNFRANSWVFGSS